MKHCILAKYRPEVYPRREELLPRIREIFAPAAELPGVHRITVYPNCVARENRYDVLIVLDMASEACRCTTSPRRTVSGRRSLARCWRRRPSSILNRKKPQALRRTGGLSVRRPGKGSSFSRRLSFCDGFLCRPVL